MIPCGEEPEMHRGWRVVYLVVRLDVELDLLAGECSDPVRTRMSACGSGVTFSSSGLFDDAMGTGSCWSRETHLISILKRRWLFQWFE